MYLVGYIAVVRQCFQYNLQSDIKECYKQWPYLIRLTYQDENIRPHTQVLTRKLWRITPNCTSLQDSARFGPLCIRGEGFVRRWQHSLATDSDKFGFMCSSRGCNQLWLAFSHWLMGLNLGWVKFWPSHTNDMLPLTHSMQCHSSHGRNFITVTIQANPKAKILTWKHCRQADTNKQMNME